MPTDTDAIIAANIESGLDLALTTLTALLVERAGESPKARGEILATLETAADELKRRQDSGRLATSCRAGLRACEWRRCCGRLKGRARVMG